MINIIVLILATYGIYLIIKALKWHNRIEIILDGIKDEE